MAEFGKARHDTQNPVLGQFAAIYIEPIEVAKISRDYFCPLVPYPVVGFLRVSVQRLK